LLFLHLAVPLGSVRGTPGYRESPVGNHCSKQLFFIGVYFSTKTFFLRPFNCHDKVVYVIYDIMQKRCKNRGNFRWMLFSNDPLSPCSSRLYIIFFFCYLKISNSCTDFTEVVYFTLESSNSEWRNGRNKQVHYTSPYLHLSRIWIFKQFLWNTARRNMSRNSQLLVNAFLLEMVFQAEREKLGTFKYSKWNYFSCKLKFILLQKEK